MMVLFIGLPTFHGCIMPPMSKNFPALPFLLHSVWRRTQSTTGYDLW